MMRRRKTKAQQRKATCKRVQNWRRQKMEVETISKNEGLQAVHALCESVEPSGRPSDGGSTRPGHPNLAPSPPCAKYKWDPSHTHAPVPFTHALLLAVHSIPQYRGQTLALASIEARATPDTARDWYAPPLHPSECAYYREISDAGIQRCTVIHEPSGLRERVVARRKTSWSRLRAVAEFRLSARIAKVGPFTGRGRWMAQIERKATIERMLGTTIRRYWRTLPSVIIDTEQ